MTAEANRKLLMRCVDLANSETDQDILIKRACSDRAAFALLYRLHYERVFRYCCRRLFSRHEAEDVTSEVFFRVMRTISTFDGNSNGFRNWLYRIATNAVNDHLKTAIRRAEAIRNAALQNGRGNAPDQESDDELQKKNLAVKQAILRLKPKYQTVITLRFFEKMKLVEIAEILGQNPATIRTQLARALSRLRKELRAAARLEP
ncbi:MAG: RNA polymerase sigma factor [Planctomycetota bacterium]|jgi:RNA polymerase sigma-70 factor (ECF subfamily)